MSRRPARFTEADVYRAVKAAKRAGGGLAVEILPNGTIRLVPAGEDDPITLESQDFARKSRIMLG